MIRTHPAGLAARTAVLIVVLLTAVWLAATPAAAQDAARGGPRFPALTGRVVDNADLIPAAQEAALTTRLEALERDTTNQLVVVTVPDLQGYEIEEYGYQLGRAWGVGQADRNNGVLLIVAPTERKVRIEVGYGLEGVLTDALSALIIHNQILPPFREGRYDVGIGQGVEAIEGQLRLDPAEAQARAAAADQPRAGAPIGPALFIVAIFFFMAMGLMGRIAGGRRRRGDGVAPILIWAASEALRNSGRGGGSSWGGGGGGFGGGGGSFGGGGASGGW